MHVCMCIYIYFTCILGYLLRISFIPQIAKLYNEKNKRLTSGLKTTHTFIKSHTKHINSYRIILNNGPYFKKNMYSFYEFYAVFAIIVWNNFIDITTLLYRCLIVLFFIVKLQLLQNTAKLDHSVLTGIGIKGHTWRLDQIKSISPLKQHPLK